MTLRVYNTLTRTKEPFETVEPGRVGMYLCGPTVYKPAHIGHMVGPVIFDTIKRFLSYTGYDVCYVINITDIDDKLINRAAEEGTEVSELAERMTTDYFENLATVGVDTVDHFPRATDHIDEMQAMIAGLIESGHAYPLEGDVYFEVSADEDYGKLSGRSVEETLAGTRVEANQRKRHPADFALWKKSRDGEPAWDSPWGAGRPGWHIECSAMSIKLLGESLDIHGGGLDLLFPHHENELAQSESCTGKPFARYWLHNGLMQSGTSAGKVGGGHDRHGEIEASPDGDLEADQRDQVAGKLAGSQGAASVKELFAVHHPETVRFFLLATHYRSPIELSDERIAEIGRSLQGFYRLFEAFERITGGSAYDLDVATSRELSVAVDGDFASYRDRFLEAMDDDFNTGGAVGALFDLRKAINAHIDNRGLDDGSSEGDDTSLAELVSAVTLLRELGGLLGVFRSPVEAGVSDDGDGLANELMQVLIELRAVSREQKNYEMADAIRDRLASLGITIEDRNDQTLWRRE
ncbi:MAG TPA: cysteine--tRNA ligase [Planctomycetaceae bacterium]|jgi:cysteinyl-tRNA synthetase|nr:cysteine--tRNA ligase [Planctomycetaceae bacterium]